jgi:hypothetical protein
MRSGGGAEIEPQGVAGYPAATDRGSRRQAMVTGTSAPTLYGYGERWAGIITVGEFLDIEKHTKDKSVTAAELKKAEALLKLIDETERFLKAARKMLGEAKRAKK